MANKLKVDLDMLANTAAAYKNSYDQLSQLVSSLDISVDNLRNSGWKSAASTKFFETFDETWKKNIKTHMLIINHLNDCLNEAQREYVNIYDKIPELGRTLE